MSQTEDYLDSLLKSVTSYKQELNKKSDISKELISREMEDFSEFDTEIGQMLERPLSDDDEFLKEFEQELLRDKELFPDDAANGFTPDFNGKSPTEEQGFFGHLDHIVNSGLSDGQGTEADGEPVRMDTGGPQDTPQDGADEVLDALQGLIDEDNAAQKEEPEPLQQQIVQEDLSFGEQPADQGGIPRQEETPEIRGGMPRQEAMPDGAGTPVQETPEARDSEGQELMDLLAQLSAEDSEMGELGNLLEAEEKNIDVGGILDEPETDSAGNGASVSEMVQEEINEAKGRKKEKRKKKDREGKGAVGGIRAILQKLFQPFSGEEDEEKQKNIVVPETGSLENISEENMEILRELEEQEADEKKEKKAKRKKKEKEPKKPKEPKKAKAPKPEKEKKPKEKMPPIPKGPLVACLVLGVSVFVLVYLFANILGASTTQQKAEQYFYKGNYTLAYEEIEGQKITEKNQDFYNKVRLMAFLSQQRDAFYYYEQAGMYENALDALVRGVERYEKYEGEAASYGLEEQYGEIEQELEQRLADTFLLSVDDAKSLYAIGDKTEYTDSVYKIVQNLGFQSVTAE